MSNKKREGDKKQTKKEVKKYIKLVRWNDVILITIRDCEESFYKIIVFKYIPTCELSGTIKKGLKWKILVTED